MSEVWLNVYDVTNTPSDSTNDSIVRLNNVTRPLGLGGVFHGGVEVNNQEWSFGYCERGTGVYSCPPKKNPMYSHREVVELGKTSKSYAEVKEIIRKLRHDWPGSSYDLLSRNCCHFCEVLCKELDVKAPPGWVNRFAMGADATVTFTNEAVSTIKNWGSTIQSTTTTSFNWMRDAWVRTLSPPPPPAAPPSSNQSTGAPNGQQKAAWPFPGLIPRSQQQTQLGGNAKMQSASGTSLRGVQQTQPSSNSRSQQQALPGIAGWRSRSSRSTSPTNNAPAVPARTGNPASTTAPHSVKPDIEVSLLGPELPMSSNSSSSSDCSGNSCVSTISLQLITDCGTGPLTTGGVMLLESPKGPMYRRLSTSIPGSEKSLLLMEGGDVAIL